MRKSRFRFSYKSHLSVFLIFCILVSQTIQVSFFDPIEAAPEDYRDIVSIIVDEETYDQYGSKVKRYSEDIQSYLGDTRVTLLVVPEDAPVQSIAAANEKLYYEGDGQEGITTLVGTILIGNIPVPMVHREGDSFPSLYPYVDFDEKRFVYDPSAERYVYSRDTDENTDVDIWHGVINPAVGRVWDPTNDPDRIGEFLDKTHDFYTRQGKFTPTKTPPRVFYYDGYNESRAINPKSLYQYSLFIANAENFAYKRFTKYLLTDINSALKRYDETNANPVLDDFAATLGYSDRGTDTLDPEVIKNLPDIHTSRPIGALVKRFHEIMNKKVLSDQQLSVHNAGRYNSGGTVRVDQLSTRMTVMDEVAMNTLKEVNTALEKAIDTQIQNLGIARKVTIFDKSVQGGKVYNGYFFGTESSKIMKPEQCTIARGFATTDVEYGQSVLVEANVGYDVTSTLSHAEILKKDTEELARLHRSAKYACFSPAGAPSIKSYWGGNTLMRVANPGFDAANVLTAPIVSDLQGFSLPIFSLGGMKETTRLRNPTLLDCQNGGYQYALLAPYIYEYNYEVNAYNGSTQVCRAGFPNEWNIAGGICPEDIGGRTPRYTCVTAHEIIPSIPTVMQSITDYKTKGCFAGSLYIDGRVVKSGTNTCITPATESGDGADNTTYEDRYYHTIPSLWKHISPTDEEISAAEKNSATPSLPVDIVRSVEFLSPKGNRVQFNYPNFFTATGTDIPSMRSWLKDLSERQWREAITRENATTLTPLQIEAFSFHPTAAFPVNPLDWNSLISDEVLEKVLRAKNWIHPDITEKSEKGLETALSFSRQYDTGEEVPEIPEFGSGYEIAYLGLTPLTSRAEDTETSDLQNEYNTQLAAINALNMGDDGVAGPDSPYQKSAQCGPPEGVMIFQWPSAILCWINSLLPPKIIGGSCGGSTIGGSSQNRLSTGPSESIRSDVAKLRSYYGSGKLVSHRTKSVLRPNDSMSIGIDFITRENAHIELPSDTRVTLDIVSLQSSGVIIPRDLWGEYIEIGPIESAYGEKGAEFSLSSSEKEANFVLRALLTLPLPDGTTYTTVSENISMRVSDEYIQVIPRIDGEYRGTIDTTFTGSVVLALSPETTTGGLLDHAYPYTLDVYDSFDESIIQTGVLVSNNSYVIPLNYTKKVGSYRFALTDRIGRTGEATLTVTSGPLSRVTFTPVSSVLVSGSDSLGVLRLTDKLGNLLTPELHTIKINARGGYIVDPQGKRIESLTIENIESELILTYGSTLPGRLSLDITIDGTVSTSTSIEILPSARVIVERSSEPQVAGDPIRVRLKIVDTLGNLISGFSSVAEIGLPEGAGYFMSGSVLAVEAGQTEPVVFIPGRVAGKHPLTLDIPGIGTITNTTFSVAAGAPMYMTPELSDTTFSFTLRDRYGNIAPRNMQGTLSRNAEAGKNIQFIEGVARVPRIGGYYTMRVPELEDNTIVLKDTNGVYTIQGIPYAVLYVPNQSNQYNFLPDYNARYTVLAGDAFLREGEDILYDVTPGASSSLAVTTLLESPYRRDTLMSIYPGGGITLGETSDSVIEGDLTLENRAITLTVRDEVRHTQIAKVAYPNTLDTLTLCTEKEALGNTCSRIGNPNSVELITFANTNISGSVTDDTLVLGESIKPLVEYRVGNGWSLAGGVTLELDPLASTRSLVLNIRSNNETIGKLILTTDTTLSVGRSDDGVKILRKTPILDTKDITYTLRQVYTQKFDPSLYGYSIIASSGPQILDENKIGPNSIDSLGSIDELAGIGWGGKNRTFLSYSAGDTVGESTRYAHTYTSVNLGDPVAHVDPRAPGTEREGIDRSIGSQILSEAHGRVESYETRDMNADGLEDIIVIYDDGFIQLLTNVGGRFRSKNMIAYIPDIGRRGISVGDFLGDGYGDIVSLDASGSLILIDNDMRKLTRTRITIGENLSQPLPSGITQYRIYDMDNDTRDDIVYLTESGELGILYGTIERGKFQYKLLDRSLGVTLSTDPETYGGAIFASVIPQMPRISPTPGSGSGIDDTMLKSQVYYQTEVLDTSKSAVPPPEQLVSDPADIARIFAADILSGTTVEAPPTQILTYIKSEYAGAYGIEIEKRYSDISGSPVRSGDRIEVDIRIRNTGSGTVNTIEYLDTIPTIFDPADTTIYKIVRNGLSEEKQFVSRDDTYDATFLVGSIPVGGEVRIVYEVRALPVVYGDMTVDLLEGGEVGNDQYGDVGFHTSTTCGADMLLWRSTAVRSYQRGTRSFLQPELPASIRDRVLDADKNGIPDSMDARDTNNDGNPDTTNTPHSELESYYNSQGNGANISNSSSMFRASVSDGGGVLDIGLSPEAISNVTNIAQNIADGLSCGFGGGSCLNSPLNWAPLAPGSAPTLFGFPLGIMAPSTGLPLFSAPTTMFTPFGPIPATYPPVPLGAGGYLRDFFPFTSVVRIFVTPTLTLGMGTAICMGGPSLLAGFIPPPGLSPFIPGGNCIVIAAPLPICKSDGSDSDGDVRGVSGLGGVTQAWNGESCTIKAQTISKSESRDLDRSIVDYLKSKDPRKLTAIYTGLSSRGPKSLTSGPLMTIGGGGNGEVNIEIDMKKPFDLGNVVKVKNIRVAAFPDFIMDWVARQTDEIINKFFSLPNLIVIPPTDLGPNFSVDGTLGSYGKAFNDASEKFSTKELQSQMKGAFDSTKVAEQYTKKTTSKTSLSAGYEKWLDKTVSENSSTINNVQGSANALKAAYKYIGQVPFLRISESAVNVNVPWPLPQELDKYMRSLEQYKTEISNLKKNWCNGKADAECLDKQTSINLSKFQSSLEANLKIIDTYRNFPQKIQKYVTWRQKYAAWALCNIETIQLFTGKWLKDNGVRFQKWAEFYVLMKAIVDSWQPIIDIFKNADAQCGVCQNQRYTLDYWKFKLLSMLIPSLPVITFPKWPDIVLDLSDFRFAINVEVPNFTFNIMPIRLPNLPSLSLPSAPTLGLSFPALPLLPQIPNLPDLPELPSLPKISLPPLPPPPKLPKLFGAIAVVTNLIKLYQTVKCLYQNSILIPEWQAGDVIAQRTARQGTLPFDFLNLQFPQFSIPGIKEIRVQTHVNLELKSDFITEFARTAVKPINEFNTDLQFAMPKKLIDDVSIQTPKNINVNLQGFLDESAASGAQLKKLASTIEEYGRTSLEVDEFIPFFRSQLRESGQSTLTLDADLRAARIEAETLVRETEAENMKQIELFKKYIQAEEAKTKELEKLIEKLQDPTSFLTYSDALPLTNYISSSPDLARERRSIYLGQDRTELRDILEATPDTEKLDRELISFQNRFSRIARSDLGTPELLTGNQGLESQYTPKFEGIYILTPSGYQTRLFDYIEPLMGGETAEVLDLDGDNKKDDYIYMIDGNLYVKLNPNDSPVRQKDTTLIVRNLDPTQVPESPNFFDEVIARPGQIDIEFSPAKFEDQVFRLEFFDRYSEWELIDIDAHDEELVPRTVVDIMVDDESRITETEGITLMPIERSLLSVSDPETFTLEWPTLRTLSAPTAFTLTAGRPLYTGPAQTRISYTNITLSGTLRTITLKPHTRYIFDEALSGSLTSGKLYFFDALSDESILYDEGMRGMPILDGMILSSTGGSFTVRDVGQDETIRIAPGGEYQFRILPYRDDSYTVNIPYKNGFYSARLRSLDSDVRAGVTLLAPQESLDQSPPLIELDDTLRIPVYQSRTYSLSGILRDQSPVTLSIDPDITQDENGDSIVDNDFSDSGSTFYLSGDILRFGPFDTLDRHTVLLRASDAFMNLTLLPVILEVYAPTPEIEGFTSTGYLYGSVENEPTEPVHLFRIRGGSSINLLTPESTSTDSEGVFRTGSLLGTGGVRFSYSGATTLIDENTGLPKGSSTLLSIDTLPATGTSPMRMRYRNSRGQYLFEQFLTLPSSTRITLSGAILSGDGPEIVVSPLGTTRSVLATLRDPSIPGGMYITDASYIPYAALARDGNIYALDPSIILESNLEGGFLTIEIKKSGSLIARIQYRGDFYYTVQ